ncbi:MAG: PilN domain-containing protein [Deltaproteobacteria bacterium]|nr:PilN domain-containing protein [Deltaproteobacteria bacterium]
MNAYGIEMREDAWKVTHVEKNIFGIKVKGSYSLRAGSDTEKVEELMRLISAPGGRAARTAIGIQRVHSMSKVVELPAPGLEALRGVVKFEIEKHIPLPVTDVYYGYKVLGKTNGLYSVFFEAVRKDVVDGAVGLLGGAGIKPAYCASTRVAYYNTLSHQKKILRDKGVCRVWVSRGDVYIDAFNKLIPVDSRSVKIDPDGRWTDSLKRALKFSGASLHKCAVGDGRYAVVAASEEQFDEELLTVMKRAANTGVEIDTGAADDKIFGKTADSCSLGLALGALGLGAFNVNVFPDAAENKGGQAALTFKLAGAALALLFLVGVSYLTQDKISLMRVESAIASTEGETGNVRKLKIGLQTADERIKILRNIDNGTLDCLAVLKELSQLLPGGTRFTAYEYSGDAIFVEGLSGQASSLVLSLEQSEFLKDVEFVGPITKTSEGMERFRIKAGIKGKNGGADGARL